MLSADDHPGIFMFVVGMIVLVMAAVGLSVLVDKRGELHNGSRLNEESITYAAAEISELTASRDQGVVELENFEARTLRSGQEQREVSAKLAKQQETRDLLAKTRETLEGEIQRLETQFSAYRTNYRDHTWKAAPGETLGDITLRDGRVYRTVVVTKVTPVGLEIRHESGIARLQAPDLSAELQDRFQWDGGRAPCPSRRGSCQPAGNDPGSAAVRSTHAPSSRRREIRAGRGCAPQRPGAGESVESQSARTEQRAPECVVARIQRQPVGAGKFGNLGRQSEPARRGADTGADVAGAGQVRVGRDFSARRATQRTRRARVISLEKKKSERSGK